jgi:hypothetical protein
VSAALQTDPPTPRHALRDALAHREKIIARLIKLARQRDDAVAAEQSAAAALDAFAKKESESWALWAEDRGRPQPIDSARRRAELVAIHHAAAREAALARRTFEAASERGGSEQRAANEAVAVAAKSVLLERAAELGAELAAAAERAKRLQAALEGIQASFSAARDGHGVAVVTQFLHGGRSPAEMERWRARLWKQCASIRIRWQALPGRLLTGDPDATETIE